jgi:superfamily II DNA/RNA helicase
MTTFSELGVSPEREARLTAQAITTPSEIQALALPTIMTGKDALMEAPTGTGKTLAYLLPLLERLRPASSQLQAIIVVPTQELGLQVRDVARGLTVGSDIAVTALIGGANPARQAEQLKKQQPQVVVGTPGRILEFVRTGKITGLYVKQMVIDEVDQMLDEGKKADLEALLKATSPSKQTVFCSATIGPNATELAKRWLKEPNEIRASGETKIPTTIQHLAVVIDEREKVDLIRKLVRHFKPVGALAFVNQAKDLPWMVGKLQFEKFKVDGLHSGVPKLDRATMMKNFKGGKLQVLVTTDLAARGLDLSGVSVVFNLDLPHDPDTYVHRVGRTGRMGKEGTAITLVTRQEAHVLEKLEKALNIKFEHPVYRFGEVREKTERDERREAAKSNTVARKEKEKARTTTASASVSADGSPAPAKKKPKKRDEVKGPSNKALAKGKAKKAKRQASGDWKKSTKPARVAAHLAEKADAKKPKAPRAPKAAPAAAPAAETENS